MAGIIERGRVGDTAGSLRTRWSGLAAAIAVGATVSVVASAAIYAGARALGLVDARVLLPSPLGMGSLSLGTVTLTALMATVAAGVGLATLAATTRRPERAFRIVASVLAVVSLAMPATIPGPGVAMRLVLGALHVAVWAVTVWLLATLAERWARSSV